MEQVVAGNAASPPARLPQSVINALLTGCHAARGGTTRSARGRRLAFIASLYSREEFLAEKGIGLVAADRVEAWLASRGLGFRKVAARGADYASGRSPGSRVSPPSPAGSA